MSEAEIKERSLKQQLLFGLIWGVMMFLFMEVIYKLFKGAAFTVKSALLGFVWWVFVVGALYGIITYYIIRYRRRKKNRI